MIQQEGYYSYLTLKDEKAKAKGEFVMYYILYHYLIDLLLEVNSKEFQSSSFSPPS